MAERTRREMSYPAENIVSGAQRLEQKDRSEAERAVFSKLRLLHLAAGLFFAAQTVLYSLIEVKATVHFTVAFPTIENGPIGEPDQTEVSSWNPAELVVIFVGLAALDHLLTSLLAFAMPVLVQRWLFDYQSNPLRWIEYSFSASIMAVAVAILAGVNDVHLLYSIFMLTSLGMVTGQLLELVPRANRQTATVAPAATKLTFALGTLLVFAPWAVSLCYFLQFSPPNFVYAAFLGTLGLFATFGINSFLHHLGGYYSFTVAEIVYVSLSFTSKTFLAADVFGGLKAA